MQTFLTHYDLSPHFVFTETAKTLDYKRLGKQRVEAKQILNALFGLSKGWVNHPCTRMWRGHEELLMLYHDIMIAEWMRRGFNNTMMQFRANPVGEMPDWFSPELVRSHRSNLIRKYPEYYLPKWTEVPDHLPYIWPV